MDDHLPNFTIVGVNDYVIEPDLVAFAKGRKLQRGRSWKNCSALYVLVNVKGARWVCLVVDLVRCQMTVYDLDINVHTDNQLAKCICPFANLILIILAATNDFSHLGKSLKKKWS